MRLLALAALLSPLPVLAQDIEEGGEIYLNYCAACHGELAKGDGPMASLLTLTPTDLSMLSQETGTGFPTSWVIARIDGRDPLIAHGSPMPVYGDFFEGKGETIRDESGVMIMTSQPIIDLVGFLKSIQQ